MMASWFTDGTVRGMKASVGNIAVKVSTYNKIWDLNDIIFANCTVLLAESEKYLQTL